MISGHVPQRQARALTSIGSLFRFTAAVAILWLAATSLPLLAQGTNAAPAPSTSTGAEDFGRYLADHQDDLAPFFRKNAEDLFKLAVPLVMGMTGWLVLATMLLGWGIDVLMARAFAFFFAPAFAEWKRSVVYATGRLFLSFVYTCLMSLAVVFSLGLNHAGVIILLMVLLLLVVALAAQIVWILYVYRTDFALSAVFYLAILLLHALAGFLIAGPIMGSRATLAATIYVDRAITPRLQADAAATKRQLATAELTRDAARAKVADSQSEITQAQMEEAQLRQKIEEKKNSDIYVLSQIIKMRAAGDLAAARDQLAAFPAKFPTSSLDSLAQTQLAQINDQLATEDEQKKQAQAEAVQAAAQAQADLLARAGKGEVTLSEMRHALIGKTRAQVSNLLGQPAETGSDSWSYRQQMILNPLTNEKTGLMVYFSEGMVQGVDYNRNGGVQ